jgi:hypothetical protein
MPINDHGFEAFIKAIRIGDKATEILLVLAPESDDAFTLTSLVDFKRRGKVQIAAKSLQPAFQGDDNWELPKPPEATA